MFAVVVGYTCLVIGFSLGVAATLYGVNESERQRKRATMIAVAERAERNPEYVPRPPAEVERAISMRQRTRFGSGVPGRK